VFFKIYSFSLSLTYFYQTGKGAPSKNSNSKFNCSETEKRPEKYAGFPAPPPSSGLFSAPYAMEVPQKKKRMVKKWANAYYGRRNRG
jgi:hypothetical protein